MEPQGPAQALQTPVAADPVAKIQAMLQAENAPPPQEQAPEQQEEEAPAGPNTQVEGDEPTTEDDQPQAAMAEIPLDQLESIELEVEVEGDKGKVTERPTIKELKLGYMRQKDYQKKTAEVARQREEVGEKVRQGIESERTQYGKDLQLLETMLLQTVAPELQNVDWNTLASTDPFEYVRLKNRADQIVQARSAIQGKFKEITDKQQAEQRAATQARAAKAREQLEQDIPGWNDGLYQTLIKSGEAYGFKPEEVGAWLDPRSLKVLHDAYQFRQMKAPSKDKKLVPVPKGLKPGTVNGQGQNQQRRADAMQRLQKSGRIEDAASIIAARMR